MAQTNMAWRPGRLGLSIHFDFFYFDFFFEGVGGRSLKTTPGQSHSSAFSDSIGQVRASRAAEAPPTPDVCVLASSVQAEVPCPPLRSHHTFLVSFAPFCFSISSFFFLHFESVSSI